MKIIILSAGTVGATVADTLARHTDNEITVIDRNESAIRNLEQRLDIQTVIGNPGSPEVLRHAGAQDAELLIAVAPNDDTNLVASRLARKIFNIPKVIAHVRQRDMIEQFSDSTTDDKTTFISPVTLFGVTDYICPEQIVTDELFRLLRLPGALQVVNFGKTVEHETLHVQLIVTKVEKDSKVVGHSLEEVRSQLMAEHPDLLYNICAIHRNETLLQATHKSRLIAGDEVYFICLCQDTPTLMHLFRPNETPIKKIMIAGGGNIGYRLAQMTEDKFQTKILEKDHLRAGFLADKLNTALVLHGSATDEDLLKQEHVEDVDLFFALTNDDEDNIMSSLISKKLGTTRVATLINRSIYLGILVGNTIDITVSPHLSTIGSILSHLRRGDVVAAHPMRRGESEMIEIIIHGDKKSSKIIGRKANQIAWPHGIVLAGIMRKNELILNEAAEIHQEDHLIFFVFKKKATPALENLVQVKWKFF